MSWYRIISPDQFLADAPPRRAYRSREEAARALARWEQRNHIKPGHTVRAGARIVGPFSSRASARAAVHVWSLQRRIA